MKRTVILAPSFEKELRKMPNNHREIILNRFLKIEKGGLNVLKIGQKGNTFCVKAK